ncbi:FHA domain-containing protein [Streptomyces sp. ISL-90]|nr:FHA domain-containing protein [Streptomyces sp. ISL-90]
MRIHVPAFPAASAIVRTDGSAELTVSGVSRAITAAGIDDARRQVIAAVVALAMQLQRPIRLSTRDGDAGYQLAVHPSGHVTELGADGYTEVADALSEASQPTIPPQVATANLTARVGTATVKPAPAPPAVPPAPAEIAQRLPESVEHTVMQPSRRAAAALEFSTGERVTVTGTGLVGRMPSAGPGERFGKLVRIDDPKGTLSRTHFAYGPTADGGVWIVDQHSSNGTWLIDDAGNETECEPGTKQTIAAGTRVEFGDHWLIVQKVGDS